MRSDVGIREFGKEQSDGRNNLVAQNHDKGTDFFKPPNKLDS